MEEQQVGGWMYLWQARKSPMMEEPIRNAACDLADHVWIMKKCVADVISWQLLGEAKFWRQASLRVLVWQVSTVWLPLNARFCTICLIIFERWNIMWLICFDIWWWRVLSTRGRAAGIAAIKLETHHVSWSYRPIYGFMFMASYPKQKHLPCPYPTSILPCPYPTSTQDLETDPCKN